MPLSIKPKLLSAADNNEKRSMCYKSNSSINMIGNHTDKTVQELFDSLLNKYQIVLEQFYFSLYFRNPLHMQEDNHQPWWIIQRDSPKWIKSKKATLNPKESNDNCFQHVITFKLNHEQTKKDPQRLIKIYVFINQYEWKDINFLSHGKE